MSDTELASPINKIIRAVTNPGPVPAFHAKTMQRHRTEWPALWSAIDELIQQQGTTYSRNLLGDKNEH